MRKWPRLVDDFYEHMKKEQELLDLSYKESVRQKRERKKKEKQKKKWEWEDFMPFYLQWYWMHDWLGNKCKAWYHGPRIDWMFLVKDKKKKRKKKK